MEPEVIVDYECEVGELPTWHPIEKRLYWADATRGRLYRYDPATGENEQCYEGGHIGGITMQADGSLLLFKERGSVARWHDGEISYIIDGIPGEDNCPFNDVIADPQGRVFGGTASLTDEIGRFYRLDTDGSIHKLLDRVECSNGLGFTPDRKGMYYTETYTETETGAIHFFDYDAETGAISNQREFVKTQDGEGAPDGMTVDAEGCVWSAHYGGSSVVRYTPDGVEERRIRFPVKQVTSVAFGGDDYTDIYVTTLGGEDRARNGALAGALFRVNVGIKGVPEFYSRVGL